MRTGLIFVLNSEDYTTWFMLLVLELVITYSKVKQIYKLETMKTISLLTSSVSLIIQFLSFDDIDWEICKKLTDSKSYQAENNYYFIFDYTESLLDLTVMAM